MDYPLVEVETKDKLPLFGLYLPKKSKTVLISIHGTASNFYENVFMKDIAALNISVLSVNNRGADALQVYPPKGAGLEHFEDCVKDIDAWVKFALSKGHKSIILQGHSLGTEKVVYYMNEGKYRKKVKAVILLAFADSFGSEKARYSEKEMSDILKKAKATKKGIFEQPFPYGGCLVKSADSYLNFMKNNSKLSKALPLRTGGKLAMYRKIKVPILAVIGDQKEYTVIPIKKAIELLRNENKLVECHQISNCNHDFEGKEKELVKIISNFLDKI